VGGSGDPGGVMAIHGQTRVYPVRMPRPQLHVKDTAPGGTESTSVSVGVLGVAEDAAGVGTLRLSVDNNSSLVLADVYDYTVYDASNNMVGSGHMDRNGFTNFTTSDAGLHTIVMTSTEDPGFSASVRYYLAQLDIKWNHSNDDNLTWDVTLATPVSLGQNISRQTISVFTGQRMAFTYDTDLPTGSIRVANWISDNIMPNAVKDYVVSNGSNQRNATDSNTATVVRLSASDFNATAHSELSLYGIADNPGRVFSLQVKVTLPGGDVVTFSNQTTFNIVKPGQSIWTGPGASPHDPQCFQVSGDIRVGHMTASTNILVGADTNWKTSVPATGYVGEISWVQLIRGTNDAYNGTNDSDPHGPGDQYWLDTRYPYNEVPGRTWGNDGPLVGGYNHLRINFEFLDWLMWTPPGNDSIAVPIQSWRWNARAMADGDTASHLWTSVFRTPASSIHPGNTKDFPFWHARLAFTMRIP
jgi:hypothetical protein